LIEQVTRKEEKVDLVSIIICNYKYEAYIGAAAEIAQGLDPSASRLPSFSEGFESIGKDREFGEHRGEPFDQRQQSHLRHCGA
jgi:hypothetical protein